MCAHALGELDQFDLACLEPLPTDGGFGGQHEFPARVHGGLESRRLRIDPRAGDLSPKHTTTRAEIREARTPRVRMHSENLISAVSRLEAELLGLAEDPQAATAMTQAPATRASLSDLTDVRVHSARR